MGFTIRRKLDLDALDWQQDAEVLRRRRQLANLSTAIAALERQQADYEHRNDELGPNLDTLLDALGEDGNAEALIAQRQAIRAQREAVAAKLAEVRSILRDQDRLRRQLEKAVSEAESRARAARAEKVEAAYRSTVEGLAKALLDAAPFNADLAALNRIAGGVCGWPIPWAELDLHSGSALAVFLRQAEAFGCRVNPVADEGDSVATKAAERYNRRQRRRAEIEAKADDIRQEEGASAAARYLSTASVEG